MKHLFTLGHAVLDRAEPRPVVGDALPRIELPPPGRAVADRLSKIRAAPYHARIRLQRPESCPAGRPAMGRQWHQSRRRRRAHRAVGTWRSRDRRICRAVSRAIPLRSVVARPRSCGCEGLARSHRLSRLRRRRAARSCVCRGFFGAWATSPHRIARHSPRQAPVDRAECVLFCRFCRSRRGRTRLVEPQRPCRANATQAQLRTRAGSDGGAFPRPDFPMIQPITQRASANTPPSRVHR